MVTKEYFEKVMQDFNQNRKGRNLRKYCSDEEMTTSGCLIHRNSTLPARVRLRRKRYLYLPWQVKWFFKRYFSIDD